MSFRRPGSDPFTTWYTLPCCKLNSDHNSDHKNVFSKQISAGHTGSKVRVRTVQRRHDSDCVSLVCRPMSDIPNGTPGINPADANNGRSTTADQQRPINRAQSSIKIGSLPLPLPPPPPSPPLLLQLPPLPLPKNAAAAESTPTADVSEEENVTLLSAAAAAAAAASFFLRTILAGRPDAAI